MKKINTLINNKSAININSPKNIKLNNNFNNNRSLSFKNINEVENSQVIIKEMQSSIDSIMNNLKNNSPDNDLSIKYLNKKNSHLYKTQTNIVTKTIYNNDNNNKTPNILDYRIKKNINKNIVKLKNNLKIDIFRNYSDYKMNNRINNNIINIDKNKITLINNILQELKLIKNNNNINKKEIFLFKKDFYEMEKILIKGIMEYFKIINKKYNLKIKELEEELKNYKNKYYDLLKNSNYKENNPDNIIIKKIKGIVNDKNIDNIKDKEIKELKDKYEKIIEEKNEEINDLNFNIIKINLEKKKLEHQKIKKHLENITNLKIENFDTQKIELNNTEINYKNKSFDNKKKIRKY